MTASVRTASYKAGYDARGADDVTLLLHHANELELSHRKNFPGEPCTLAVAVRELAGAMKKHKEKSNGR